MGVAVWVWAALVPAAPVPPQKGPTPAPAVAAEFLRLALDGKAGGALKLTVAGTISENKVGELKELGVADPKPVAVLTNDTRVEVVYARQRLAVARAKQADAHLVLMLVKSKDGAWRVKDIDLRDEAGVAERVKLYLAGRYDEKAKKD